MLMLSNHIPALNVRKSPKFSRPCRKSGSMNTTVTLDLRAEVKMWPFRVCAMHPAIIGTVRSLCTWLCGRYHVPQNVFLVLYMAPYTLYCIVLNSSSCHCWSHPAHHLITSCSCCDDVDVDVSDSVYACPRICWASAVICQGPTTSQCHPSATPHHTSPTCQISDRQTDVPFVDGLMGRNRCPMSRPGLLINHYKSITCRLALAWQHRIESLIRIAILRPWTPIY